MLSIFSIHLQTVFGLRFQPLAGICSQGHFFLERVMKKFSCKVVSHCINCEITSDKSVNRLFPHSTTSGLLPSPYPVSVLRVVTSNIDVPLFTVIVPNFTPVGIVSSNDSMTSSGVAVVQISYSLEFSQ